MPIALGVMPNTAPVPTGLGKPIRSSNAGTQARPGSGSFMCQGPGQVNGMEIYSGQHSTRFWWHVGCSCIIYGSGAWERIDHTLNLLVPGYGYGTDLLGMNFYQKACGYESTGHPDPWCAFTMEGVFYCEANSDYWCRWLTAGGAGSYYQAAGHMNMWSYTVGEGVY